MAPPKKKKPAGRLTLSRDLPVAAVSPNEAAQMYGVSRQLLYTYMRTGRLKSSKVGYRRIIRIADLEAFLDSFSQ